MRTLGVGLVVLIAAAGCAVGPTYRSPKLPVPAEWSEPRLGGAADGEAEVVRWWATFRDPTLDSLIERAAESNHDLRLAAARVRAGIHVWNAREEQAVAGQGPKGN